MMMNANSYQRYLNLIFMVIRINMYEIFYSLTREIRLAENDSIGHPAFSEIGFYAGISQTDWSWTPLLQILTMMALKISSSQMVTPKMLPIMILFLSEINLNILQAKQLLQQFPG